MTTKTSTFDRSLAEFHPERCDVDLVVMVGIGRLKYVLGHWNGKKWKEYDNPDINQAVTCLAEHSGELLVGQKFEENRFGLLRADAREPFASRPFPIVSVTERQGRGLVDLVRLSDSWMEFGTVDSRLNEFENTNIRQIKNAIPTPIGFYVHNGRAVRKLFGYTDSDLETPSDVMLEEVCLGKMDGDKPVFYARTLKDHAPRDNLNFLHFVSVTKEGGETVVNPLCVAKVKGKASINQLYSANAGSTLYFSDAHPESTTIVRADIRDSINAEARPVLKMRNHHRIQYFGIFPHGKIDGGER